MSANSSPLVKLDLNYTYRHYLGFPWYNIAEVLWLYFQAVINPGKKPVVRVSWSLGRGDLDVTCKTLELKMKFWMDLGVCR